MLENKRLFTEYDNASNFLIEKFLHNDNTKSQLENNKLCLQQKFEHLSELADSLKIRLEELSQEHNSYLILIETTCGIMQEAEHLLSISKISNEKIDHVTNTNLKQNAFDLENCENILRDQLNKFKELNANNAERISRIYEITNPCSSLVTCLREARLSILDFVQERNYVILIKLTDVDKYLNTFAAKLNIANEIKSCNKLALGSDLDNYDSLCSEELSRVINNIKYLLNNDAELNKCQKLLIELENQTSDEQHRAKICTFKERIQKFKNQIRLVTSPNTGMYHLVIKLKELNEELFDKSVMNKSQCTLKIMQESFIKIRADLEKEMAMLEGKNMHLMDLNAFRHVFFVMIYSSIFR